MKQARSLLQKFGAHRGRRTIVDAAVRTDVVVFFAVGAGDDLRLQGAFQQFAVEAFVAEAAVEAFVYAVLPGAARLDEARDDAALIEPALEHAGDKLAAVVAAQVPGLAPVAVEFFSIEMDERGDADLDEQLTGGERGREGSWVVRYPQAKAGGHAGASVVSKSPVTAIKA